MRLAGGLVRNQPARSRRPGVAARSNCTDSNRSPKSIRGRFVSIGARSTGLVVLVACSYPSLAGVVPDADSPLPGGAKIWLPMEDTDPSSAIVDAAGNHSVRCTMPACPSSTPNGKHGNGFRFSGHQYLKIYADARDLDPIKDAYTIGVWEFLEVAPVAPSYESCAFTKPSGIPGPDGNSFTLCVDAMGEYEYITSEGGERTLHGPAVPLRTWHHLAASWDRNSQTTKLYFDGAPQRSLDDINIGFDNGVPIVGADANPDTSNAREFWTGILDDVVLYDRVLTPDEVCELAGKPPPC
jgi:hypothetical protein